MRDGRKGVGLEGESCKKLQFCWRNIQGLLPPPLLSFSLLRLREVSHHQTNLENPDEDVNGNRKGTGSTAEFLVPWRVKRVDVRIEAGKSAETLGKATKGRKVFCIPVTRVMLLGLATDCNLYV